MSRLPLPPLLARGQLLGDEEPEQAGADDEDDDEDHHHARVVARPVVRSPHQARGVALGQAGKVEGGHFGGGSGRAENGVVSVSGLIAFGGNSASKKLTRSW